MRTLPSAAQSLHQCHRRGHFLHLEIIQSLPVGQNSGLRDQHIDVRINPGLVPSLFEREIGLREIYRLLFLLNFLGKNAHFGKSVFYLLKGRQNCLPIGGEIRIVGRHKLLDRGPPQAGIKNSFREVGANGKESAGPR